MKKLFNLTSTDRVTMMIRIRWVTLVCVIAIVIVTIINGTMAFPLPPIIIFALIAGAYSAIMNYLNGVWKDFSEKRIYAILRCTADILAITGLVHFTGGVNSYFVLLYLLDPLAVCLFYGFGTGFFLALEAIGLYSAVCFLEANNVWHHYATSALTNLSYLDRGFIFSSVAALFYLSLAATFAAAYAGENIIEKQEELTEMSASKVEFIDEVVHETKGPLTSILGYIELITGNKLGSVSGPQREPLLVIQRQAQRILSMVNDLLSLARLESGKRKLEKTSANILDIAARAIEEVTPSIDAGKLALVREFDPQTPLVKLNEDKIEEVFINLLSNAVKFSNEGGRIFVSIAPVETPEKAVRVTVRDEGLGIEAIDLPHIFDRFYRASKESLGRKGTGLGLALCRLIVETHGGKIWAESAGPGKGAVFSFTLPL